MKNPYIRTGNLNYDSPQAYQHLQHKSIAQLKQIYSEIGCTIELTDKRCKDSWISAIANYQASKIQKLAPAAPDNQALAQAELDNYITTQAQAVAPEPLTTVEISFYDHEVYAGNRLIASITHDDNDFVTQRWVVMVNGAEEHRADTWAKCYRYIQWHYQDGTLPVQEKLDPEANDTSSNEIMAQTLPHAEAVDCEELLDRPFDELTTEDWQLLREYTPVAESRELVTA